MTLQGLTDDQLRAELQRRKLERSKGCTGVAASWCPRCGACTCPRVNPEEDDFDRLDEEDDNCPLHSAESPHAEAGLAALGIGR